MVLAALLALSGWFYGTRIFRVGLTSIHSQITPYADLIPAWQGSRELLFAHGDPYSDQVTERSQVAVYGYKATNKMDQQRFAYPVYSAFLFLPFAALSFAAAQKLAFVVFALLTILSIRWWTGPITVYAWTFGSLLLAASLPMFYAIYCRQPTLLFMAILAASFAAIRSDRLVLAGVLLALATAKPQLAVMVLLPAFCWMLSQFSRRRRLLIAFLAIMCLLLVASELLCPGWMITWVGVLRDYQKYTPTSALLVKMAGARLGIVLSAALLCAMAYVAWRLREDLAFTIALSVASFALAMPIHVYDYVALLAPICWIATHRAQLTGWISHMLTAAVVLCLAEGWITASALALLSLISQKAALAVWDFPLQMSGALPFAILFTLSHHTLAQRLSMLQCTPAPASVLEQSEQS